MTSVHKVKFCEVKSCVFVNNKSIIKMFLTLHHCLRLKKVSSEKAFSSESGEKYAQFKHRLQVKTVQNSFNSGFWCMRTTGEGISFFTGGSIIMAYGLVPWPEVMF